MLSPGDSAPDFQLTTTAGERLSLQQALAAGPVLLAFFKVGCPTCQFTLPFLQRIHTQLDAPQVKIWGIVQDAAPDANRFAEAFGIDFPILIDDPPYKVSKAYRLSHVPSIFLVDGESRIDAASMGFAKADLLAIQRSLAERVSATPPPLFLATEKIPDFKPG
jgi:peroxiredoxin